MFSDNEHNTIMNITQYFCLENQKKTSCQIENIRYLRLTVILAAPKCEITNQFLEGLLKIMNPVMSYPDMII